MVKIIEGTYSEDFCTENDRFLDDNVYVFRLENYTAMYEDGEVIKSDKAYLFLGRVKYEDMPENILSAVTAAYDPSPRRNEREYTNRHPELRLTDISVHMCDSMDPLFKIVDNKIEFEFNTYQDYNKEISCNITADLIGPGKLWTVYAGNNALRVEFNDVFDSLANLKEFNRFLHTGEIFDMEFVQMIGDKV